MQNKKRVEKILFFGYTSALQNELQMGWVEDFMLAHACGSYGNFI
jgi:hypothetical protein